jgi:hypothetical protein
MIKQKNYLIPEKCMCDVCREAVVNPICPSCITTEIEAWLVLYPNLKDELMPRLEKFLEKIKHKTDATQCIQCKNKRAAVCPYCFTAHVLEHLKELNSNRMILGEFFEFFNFDLHHTGYTREAEKLGFI